MSPQCGDNLLVGEHLREAQHVTARFLVETATEQRRQLSTQRGDNLGAVGRALAIEHRSGTWRRRVGRAEEVARMAGSPATGDLEAARVAHEALGRLLVSPATERA